MTPAAKVSFKFDFSRFDRTMRQYREVSRRTNEEIVDAKAFFMARRAVVETPTVPLQKIKAEMMQEHSATRSDGSLGVGPRAALIINARRGEKGLPGLYGRPMRDAVKQLIAARNRSRSFLRSGWIPAIKALEPLVKNRRGAAPAQRQPRQYGQPKGYGTPARRGQSKATAILSNSALSTHDHKQGFPIKAQAFQRAIDAEEASMRQYIEDKHRKAIAAIH